jgi:hypothetical protein
MDIGENGFSDRGESARREGRFVFECSWEVANKGNFCHKNKFMTNICIFSN